MRDSSRSAADKGGDELGGFVLNDDMAVAEGAGLGDVAGLEPAGGGEKSRSGAGARFLPAASSLSAVAVRRRMAVVGID